MVANDWNTWQKYDAIVGAGIPILERVPIPADMLPPDSKVEIDAKIAAGYFTTDQVPINLEDTKGRTWYVWHGKLMQKRGVLTSCCCTGMISSIDSLPRFWKFATKIAGFEEIGKKIGLQFAESFLLLVHNTINLVKLTERFGLHIFDAFTLNYVSNIRHTFSSTNN